MTQYNKTTRLYSPTPVSAILCAALLVQPAISQAWRGDYGVGVKFEHSDNAELTDDNEINEMERALQLGFGISQEGSRLSAEITSLAEFRDFRDDVYNDDVRLDFSGVAAWQIVPDRLSWEVEDYFTQLLEDSVAPDTPDNEVNTNVFSTGPVFTARVSPTDDFIVTPRYTRIYYEDESPDSRRWSSGFRYQHRRTQNTSIAGNVFLLDVDFDDDDTTPDYTRGDLYASLASAESANEYLLDLGVSQFNRDRLDDVTGFLGRFNWIRRFRAQSFLEINAVTQYTDTGSDLLAAGQEQRPIDAVSEQVSGDIFLDKRAEVIYRLGTAARSAGFRVGYRDEDYEVVPLDRETWGARVSGNYMRSAALSAGAYVQYRRFEYSEQDVTDKDTELGVSLNYLLTRKIAVSTEYDFQHRDSTETDGDFSENRIMLRLYYGQDPFSYRNTPL